ncbi:MAG: hypothetical protein WB988_04235, partial [Candidatus Nitrosopolaris sp.]
MADFAKVCETISRCMGNDPDTFIKAYDRNIQLQTEQILESNVIAPVIVKFMNDKQEWIGSATELLADMETLAATMKVNTKSRAWPKGPNILIRRLNEVKATLEEVKIFITRGLDNKSKVKTVEIRKRPLLSLPSLQDEERAQITSDPGNDTGNDTVTPAKASLPKEGQNRAQIGDCYGSNGSNDTLQDCTESLRLPLACEPQVFQRKSVISQSIGNAKNSTFDASVTSVDSSEVITDKKNIENTRLTLRHSPAAVVVTNNDLEDIEDRGIENNTSSSSGGESA